VDSKATFAAPRMKDMEQPLMDRMGDWWNSVFNTAPPPAENEVAAVPEASLPQVNLEPPVLEPPPRSLGVPLPPTEAGTFPVRPDAPVVVDAQPQRVPAFPRPLEAARPADSIPGTQVYRTPEATARMPDPSTPPDVVRAPSQTARVEPAVRSEPVPRAEPSATMGAAPARPSVPIYDASPASGSTSSSDSSAFPSSGSSAQPVGEASGSVSAPAQ
jgi:hypothetical protein